MNSIETTMVTAFAVVAVAIDIFAVLYYIRSLRRWPVPDRETKRKKLHK